MAKEISKSCFSKSEQKSEFVYMAPDHRLLIEKFVYVRPQWKMVRYCLVTLVSIMYITVVPVTLTADFEYEDSLLLTIFYTLVTSISVNILTIFEKFFTSWGFVYQFLKLWLG